MRRRYCITSLLLCTVLSVSSVLARSPEVERARTHGAEGQVTLRVVDPQGAPVTNAFVKAGFYNPHKRDQAAEGRTDTNGCFVAAGLPVEDMRYSVSKSGYYGTEGTYVFYRRGSESPLKDGRWQPWNPTHTVVLKERRSPVPMCARNVDTTIPVQGEPVGFDLEKGDWVGDYGKGETADLLFTYRAQVQDPWTFSRQLIIGCTDKMDGLQAARKDTWSELLSWHEAPVDGYDQSVTLIFDRTKKSILKSEEIDRSEYLVFRVRTVLDDDGNIVSANYGKIYGPVDYGPKRKGQHRLRFTYYFNPDGTRNLEYDPGKNLLPPLHRGDRVPLP